MNDRVSSMRWFALVAVLVTACEPAASPLARPSVSSGSSPVLIMTGIRAQSWTDGVKAWESVAERGVISADHSTLRSSAVRLDRAGDGLWIESRDAQLELKDRALALDGAVRAGLSETPKTGGEGESEVPVEITAEHFQGQAEPATGTFQGKVVLTRGALRLTCDLLKVQYDRDRQQVERLEARGHVTIESAGRRGTGQRAVFERRPGRVLLEGNPVLSSGRDEMSGERIVWELETDRIDCVRCRVRWAPERGGKGAVP